MGKVPEKIDKSTPDRLERGTVERRRTGTPLELDRVDQGGLVEGQGHMYVCTLDERMRMSRRATHGGGTHACDWDCVREDGRSAQAGVGEKGNSVR